ncbi:MAG: hypothetical protein M3O35_19210 [Acidobacteriota bacterium]|nr:hypothetical protein [Acidobacteriota bacterium]
MHLSVHELLHYPDEERGRWERWFRENGEDLLKMPLAGDRESTVGALVLHIFAPEVRYVQRLRNQELDEYRDEMFGLCLTQSAHPEDWDRSVEFAIAGRQYSASARKIVTHVLLHEVRHWTQVALA